MLALFKTNSFLHIIGSDELTEAKMTFNAFVHQVNDIYHQLTDNEQELKVLRVKNENARAAEEMQAVKVSEDNVQRRIDGHL